MLTLFTFQPLDWVTITMYGVNYKGRVVKCHLYPGNDVTYTVEFIGNDGDFKSGDFRADELTGNSPL